MDVYEYFERVINDAIQYEIANGFMPTEFSIEATADGWEVANRNNESLEIASTDKVTASFVMGGKTYTTTYTVSDSTVQDIFRNLNDEYNVQNGNVTAGSETGSYKIETKSTGVTVAKAVNSTALEKVETETKTTDAADDADLTAPKVGSGVGVSSSIATHSYKVKDADSADAFGFAVDTLQAPDGSTGTTVVNAGVDSDGFTVNSVDSAGTVAGVSLVSASKQIGVKGSMDRVNTADGTMGISVTAKHDGIEGQISGLTISISDSEGNVKKSANAALDAFSTQIYAKNKSDANELSFHVGASANQSIAVSLDDMRSEALGLKGSDGSKVSVATQDKANAAVSVFDNAIQKALDQQATIGAIESRLDYTSSNLTTSSENVQAAESTILTLIWLKR